MAWISQTTTLADCVKLLRKQDNLVSASLKREDRPIAHLSYNSQKVKQDTLFICKGAHFIPEYLLEAAKQGALAYMSERDYSDLFEAAGLDILPALVVKKIRPALADVAAFFYRGLLDNITLIGFTGTKGKTTTTYMLASILDSWLESEGKRKSAWLSSIENYDGTTLSRSLLTTEDVLELYEHFVNAVHHKIEYLTMEVSSQALKYDRTRNLRFEVAGFLNIGEDHISSIEHPSHEDYLSSKLEIFKQSTCAVINRESEAYERILRAAQTNKRVITFGYIRPEQAAPDREADTSALFLASGAPRTSSVSDTKNTLVASDIRSTVRGLRFFVETAAWREQFLLPMAGRFNVENALAAIAVAQALEVPVEHIKKGLARTEVSGRMQLIAGSDEKLIVIDYAHNKMSFETIFKTMVHEYPNRSIVSVFGATGGKGTERRRELPGVAVKYASKIYVTEDDPGEEPLEHINRQIAEVIEAAGVAYETVEDRSEAIRRAYREAPKNSLILILGKGHETVMKRGRASVLVPSDKERVKELLKEESG